MVENQYASLPRTFALMFKAKVEGIFVWTWSTVVACLIAGRGFPPAVPTIMTVASMLFLAISVYFYNDVIDQEMDSLNEVKKDRPLPSGAASERNVMIIVYATAIIGLALAYQVNPYSFLFSLIYWVVYYLYSFPGVRLKNRFLMKDLVIFSGFPLCSLVGSYAITGALSMAVLVPGFLFAIYSSAANPIFGDSLDMEEDSKFGVKNLALLLSWKRKAQLMVFGVLFIMTVTPLTYVQLGFNMLLPLLTVLMSLFLLKQLIPLMGAFDGAQVASVRKYVYGYMVVFELLVIIGTLNINLF